MKNSIPDETIKEHLRALASGKEMSYPKIVSILAQYIYNYPRVIFGADTDQCGDFFEYMLFRLRNILDCYRESEAKFFTWFTVVLRNRYLNFVRAEYVKNRAQREMSSVSIDARWGDYSSLHGLIGDSRQYGEQQKEEYDKLIEGIVTNLKDRLRVFFHLYYIETLRPEDVGFLSINLDRSTRTILEGIDMVRNSLTKKYSLKNGLYQKLGALYNDFLRAQREGDHEKAEKLKKKREKVLDEYRQVKLNPSYEIIARILNVPIGTVSTGIMRMKRDVRRYVEEISGEKMPIS
ncbi:MAG: hypothetical protein AMS17_01435 [Spirochaetes bacterium DG_61]|nr:MAG: hypothetical protein AMS17_01435 [Spirochaetes bacterium DG_61]